MVPERATRKGHEAFGQGHQEGHETPWGDSTLYASAYFHRDP